MMKTDNFVNKQFENKHNHDFGRCPPKSLLDVNQSKYKDISEVIADQYQRQEIPEHRLYMIDKVVRMRSQYGRFGIDHSELLNYELEQTNKPRDDHMNWLVHERAPFKAGSEPSTGPDSDKKPEMAVSKILFERLNVKDEEKDFGIYDKTKSTDNEKKNHRLSY